MNVALMDPFLIPSLSKTTIGFDDMIKKIQELSLSDNSTKLQSYPPYNIIKHSETNYSIELAVAGFTKDHLKVSVEDGVLIISGTYDSRNEEPQYIHKGIAERAFIRRFTLSDHVVVKNSVLSDGILNIWLEKIIPENKKPIQIEIQ